MRSWLLGAARALWMAPILLVVLALGWGAVVRAWRREP